MTRVSTPVLFLMPLLAAVGCAGAPPVATTVVPPPPSVAYDAAATGPLTSDAGSLNATDSGELGVGPEPSDDEPSATDEHEEIDDGADSPESSGQVQTFKHPLDGWSKQKIASEFAKNPESLGSMSVGYTNGGALVNGVQMPTDDIWELVDANHAWGTRETVDYLVNALHKVSAGFPGCPKMYIGHISARNGGHLSPHVSHQAGRDVDISYYYLPGTSRWYATARATNLDRERTWAFVKTLIADSDIELILMDRSVQRLVRQYALAHGENSAWVAQIFDGSGGLPPLIRHAKGHATHLHVRFYNPLAQETGRRLYDLLLARHMIPPASRFVHHKVKQGETLGMLAKKYGVSPKAIQQANGMKSNLIRASQDYKIPQHGGVRGCPKLTVIPARRLPPEPSSTG